MTPAGIRSHIRWAWIITMLMGLGTIISWVGALYGAVPWLSPRPILLARGALVLLLAWGIHWRSRAAISIMLALFLWSRLDVLLRFPMAEVRLFAAVSLLVFGYVLVQGARAIFAFHTMKRHGAIEPDAA